MSEIEFLDELPPNGNLHKGNYEHVRRALKANPGRWALAAEGKNPGTVAAFTRLGFQTATRNSRIITHPDGTLKRVVDVYARWPQ